MRCPQNMGEDKRNEMGENKSRIEKIKKRANYKWYVSQ